MHTWSRSTLVRGVPSQKTRAPISAVVARVSPGQQLEGLVSESGALTLKLEREFIQLK